MDNYNNSMGTVAGAAVGWSVYKYLPNIKKPYRRWVFTEFQNVSETQNNNYASAAQKVFEKTGLKAKGIEIIDVNSTNWEKVANESLEKSDKNLEEFIKKLLGQKEFRRKEKKPRPKWKYILFGPCSKEKFKENIRQVSEGKNACYHFASKNVLVNKDKMGFSTFHEIGHAINFHSSKAMKYLSVSHPLIEKYAIPVLLAIALIKKRKPDSENRYGESYHKKNFLKDNIGLITFGCFVPGLIDEGMASVNGTKLAKKVLKGNDVRKLNVLHGKAWSTYLAGALAVSIFAQFAVNIKDSLTQNNNDKTKH